MYTVTQISDHYYAVLNARGEGAGPVHVFDFDTACMTAARLNHTAELAAARYQRRKAGVPARKQASRWQRPGETWSTRR